jgi:MFS family permease
MTANRSRWIALYVLCVGMLMIVLDVTVVNVALPSIQDDLGFSTSSLAWVVNGYLISFGGLLLLAGRLGDLLGRRTIFLAGLALFTGASALCGLAQSAVWLVAARFVQGIGGAITSAVILGMIVTMFPEPREQAKAIGVYAFVASAGGSVGLLAGGVLTQAIDWHCPPTEPSPFTLRGMAAGTRRSASPGVRVRKHHVVGGLRDLWVPWPDRRTDPQVAMTGTAQRRRPHPGLAGTREHGSGARPRSPARARSRPGHGPGPPRTPSRDPRRAGRCPPARAGGCILSAGLRCASRS